MWVRKLGNITMVPCCPTFLSPPHSFGAEHQCAKWWSVTLCIPITVDTELCILQHTAVRAPV
jgi:hypothetical protein